MSFHLLILAASTTAPAPDIKACADAVHSDLTKAEQACDIGDAKIDLFKPGGLSDACLPAFNAGKQIGKMGARMAPVMRASLTRDFDKKLAACTDPAPKKEVPILKTTQLWE